jgi:beta-mannosidase
MTSITACPQPLKKNVRSLLLDGAWRLSGANPTHTAAAPLHLQATVPGHVHPELQREGLIPDPFWRDQAEQCQWVEDCIWTYEREFDLDPADLNASANCLVFEGLDTYAQIWLNDVLIGTSENMFIAHRFEVGKFLRPGCNHLRVVLLPDKIVHADKDYAQYFSCFSSDRVFSRRMQCAYGWDWTHRLVGAGIWRSVYLQSWDVARIEDLFVFTHALQPGSARLGLQLQLEGPGGAEPLQLQLRLRDQHGLLQWTDERPLAENQLKLAFELPQPELWFPNGYGAQPLYSLEATLSHEGDLLDQHTVQFGIRTIEIEELAAEPGKTFTLKVNGQRIFVKGGNWVPADPFPGRIRPEHYDRLISLAQRARMNLLRAWGGGIYEPEPFWEACDQTGVMVSQDFLLACAEYPEDDPAFLQQLRVEFAQAIRRLRNHPSLAFWCGDNELGLNCQPEQPYPGKKIAAEITQPLCQALDPTRPFRATSPFGGESNNSSLEGDCHLSAWYDNSFMESDMLDYRQRIARLSGRFLSESACMGSPPKSVLLKFMTEQDLDDPERHILEYHTKDNPYNGVDHMTHLRILEKTAATLFGPPASTDQRIAHLEYVHYEWVRLTTESLRRKKFACSGIQYWMFNDNWPAFGWSHVDYWGRAKSAFFADLHANQPVIATIEETTAGWRVWVCNDALVPVAGSLRVLLQGWSGPPVWHTAAEFAVAANISMPVLLIDQATLAAQFDHQKVLVAEISGQFGAHRAWLYPALPRDMQLPPTHLRVERSGDDDQGLLRISCDNYARVVTLTGDVDFSDNYFDLLPGETRQVTWQSLPDSASREITVTCWNQSAKGSIAG